jgi:hypothetical protein
MAMPGSPKTASHILQNFALLPVKVLRSLSVVTDAKKPLGIMVV